MANKTETVTAGPEETDSWAADLSPPQTAVHFELSPALKPQQQPCSPSAVILHISIPVCSAGLWEIKSAFFKNMTHFVLSKGIVFNIQGLNNAFLSGLMMVFRLIIHLKFRITSVGIKFSLA